MAEGRPSARDERAFTPGDRASSGAAPLDADPPPPTPTRQFAGLVLVPVIAAQRQPLGALLDAIDAETIASMQGHPPERPILPFHALRTVHYARFVVIDDAPGRAWLAFCTDYDGPEGKATCSDAQAWKVHLADLLAHAEAGLERVFACCEGFRAGELARYLTRHRLAASTFYVGSSGRSLRQIRWEAALRQRVERLLDQGARAPAPAETVRERVLVALAEEGVSVPAFPPQPDFGKRLALYKWGGLALAIGALGLACSVAIHGLHIGWRPLAAALSLGVVLLVARFRWLELHDAQFQPEYSAETHQRHRTASAGENHLLQNQLTHLVAIKPGPLRWLSIRIVFAVLQVLARYHFNKGRLGDIPSIHFARWALIPGRRVLFFSNFDSSWQSYLGDFIDRASNGLTAVWSNTVLYPRTRWLLEAGSQDASRFLAWTRHHQRPSQVWYSAYPGLSIVNINDNTEIRRGLGDRASLDAATWLFRLRNVDRVRTDQQYGDEQTRDPSLPLDDIQGLIVWGYGHMPEARYLLFRVDTPSLELLRWLGALPLNSASTASTAVPPEPVVNVAFTDRGLRALGVSPELCDRFATAFIENSHDPYRTRVNGDVGPSAPEHWAWGSAGNPAHVLLLVYAATRESIAQHAADFVAQAEARGLVRIAELEGTTLEGRKEHFGFRDGIAQPTIQGSGRAELAGNTVAAGEFLLGHRDGYGNVTHSPVSPRGFNFGRNGSYLVLRQLEQDVEAFWRYCAAHDSDDPVLLASKMVGRWPGGAPLVRHPRQEPNPGSVSDDDAFSYIANDEDNDRYGARCPFGSHVRRSNPRDWALADSREESLRLANLHRIIRRGRPYGEPLRRDMSVRDIVAAATAPQRPTLAPTARRGLSFLCFNANLERQFEFIQQQWCNNPKFAGLESDPDPLLGVARTSAEWGTNGPGFTLQSDAKTRIDARCTELQRFVKVVGSSYFFMPSIPAVRLLGRGLLGDAPLGNAPLGNAPLGNAPKPALERPPPDEQRAIDRLTADLRAKIMRDDVGGKTLRDGHPKMHGLVEARFRVEPRLPPELAIGLFAEPKVYRAWVRFSNESGRVAHDERPDVRGAALKIAGVDGFKLLDGQEHCTTHDFILTTREGFVTRDAAEFSELIHGLVSGPLALGAFFLTHPRVAVALLRARQRTRDLLAARYFSGVPYLLGTAAVKYSLVPTSGAPAASPDEAHHDFLREALKARLAAGSASFDFQVQIHPNPTPDDIEDSRVAWSQSQIPFRKVATLEIPQQDFDTPEQQERGENFSFNPWRCLPEHRPLGGLNRARRQVYPALSATRHGRNAAPFEEPE